MTRNHEPTCTSFKTIEKLKRVKKDIQSIIAKLAETQNPLHVSEQLQAIENAISRIKKSVGINSLTLDSLLCNPMIEGGQWGDLFILLTEEFKYSPSASILEKKAKERCLLYVDEVKKKIIDERLTTATTVSQKNYVRDELDRLAFIRHEVKRVWNSAETAKQIALATLSEEKKNTQAEN